MKPQVACLMACSVDGRTLHNRCDYTKLSDRWVDLMDVMMSAPSRSQSEIKAKASVILIPMTLGDPDRATAIAESLANDILRRAKTAGRASR